MSSTRHVSLWATSVSCLSHSWELFIVPPRPSCDQPPKGTKFLPSSPQDWMSRERNTEDNSDKTSVACLWWRRRSDMNMIRYYHLTSPAELNNVPEVPTRVQSVQAKCSSSRPPVSLLVAENVHLEVPSTPSKGKCGTLFTLVGGGSQHSDGI